MLRAVVGSAPAAQSFGGSVSEPRTTRDRGAPPARVDAQRAIADFACRWRAVACWGAVACFTKTETEGAMDNSHYFSVLQARAAPARSGHDDVHRGARSPDEAFVSDDGGARLRNPTTPSSTHR